MPKRTLKNIAVTRKVVVRNVIVIGDTHIGCKMGLMHPDGAETDEGTLVKPSALGLKLWNIWEWFWEEWVPNVTRGEPYDLIHMGDAIDGVHHNSTTQWSHNLADQRRHAIKILSPVVARAHRYYHIRGTEAHVGQSATEEEQLAKALGAQPNEYGNYARWELWKMVGRDTLCHFTHHIGTTSSATHESSALEAEMSAALIEAGRWGRRPPDIIVRAHRHRHTEARKIAKHGYLTGFIVAAWQLRTPFAFRTFSGRNFMPHVGGSLIREGDEETYTRHSFLELDRERIEA